MLIDGKELRDWVKLNPPGTYSIELKSREYNGSTEYINSVLAGYSIHVHAYYGAIRPRLFHDSEWLVSFVQRNSFHLADNVDASFAFAGCKNLKSVSLENMNIHNADYMFRDNYNLDSIYLNNVVFSGTGDSIFKGCVNDRGFNFTPLYIYKAQYDGKYVPADLGETFPYSDFSSPKLAHYFENKSLSFPHSIGPDFRLPSVSCTEISFPGIVNEDFHIQLDCVQGGALGPQGEITVHLPNAISIRGLFLDNTDLKRAVVDAPLAENADYAFYRCTLMREVPSVNCYPVSADYMFYNCDEMEINSLAEALGKLSFLQNVKSLDNTFAACHNIKFFAGTFLNLQHLKETFLECSKLEEVVIQAPLLSYTSSAFVRCSHLKSVYINSYAISSIAYEFCNLENLETVIIPNGSLFELECAFKDSKKLVYCELSVLTDDRVLQTMENTFSGTRLVYPNLKIKMNRPFNCATWTSNHYEKDGFHVSVKNGFNTRKTFPYNVSNNSYKLPSGEYMQMPTGYLTLCNFSDITWGNEFSEKKWKLHHLYNIESFQSKPGLGEPYTTDISITPGSNNFIMTKSKESEFITNLFDVKDLILNAFPVSSVYLTINNINPSTFLGGKWIQVSSGKVLQGASALAPGGTSIEPALPNIKGTVGQWNQFKGSRVGTGAFSSYSAGGYVGFHTLGTDDFTQASFDAHKYNPIYSDDCNTVQPPAFCVYVWYRIA